MSAGGHKTSAIPRPADANRTNASVAGTRPTQRRDDTGFRDLTRPIPQEKRLVKGRGKRAVLGLGAAVIVAALIGALFVLPVKAWLRQQDDISKKQSEAAALEQANGQLADEVNRLNTPEGIEEAARQEIGFVRKGEIRLTVLPAPAAPVKLPGGWPYDTVAKIITVRKQAVGTTTAP